MPDPLGKSFPKPSMHGSGVSGTPGTSQHNAADPTSPHINSSPVKNAIEVKVFLKQRALIATDNNFTYKTLANILFNTAHKGKIPDLTASIIKAVGFLIMNKASSQISDELLNTLINKSLTAGQPLINDLEHKHDFIKSIKTCRNHCIATNAKSMGTSGKNAVMSIDAPIAPANTSPPPV